MPLTNTQSFDPATPKPPSIMATTPLPSKVSPHVPIELALIIVDNIPVDHILPLRGLCHGIKEHIDNKVLYSYLCRTTIAADFVPLTSEVFETLPEKDAAHINLMKFVFLHTEDDTGNRARPAWERSHAVFNVSPQWLDAFNRACARSDEPPGDLEDCLYIKEEEYRPEADESPSWFVQLDCIAFDLDTGITTRDGPESRYYSWTPGHFHFDVNALTVTIDWRIMLRNLLVTAAEIERRKLVFKPPQYFNGEGALVDDGPVFTFGPEEDFIRDFRRDYLWRLLDTMHPKDYNTDRGLIRLPRLFGQRDWDGWGEHNANARLIKYNEDCALKSIMQLRGGS